MDISFLIVTKNRPKELQYTLSKIHKIRDEERHEVLVFIDGCAATEKMQSQFPWVQWTVSKESISASPARAILYKKAVGEIFIGLDDDAHPISQDFIKSIQKDFEENPNLGIISFQEVKGIYKSDQEACLQTKHSNSYMTNEFIGCGFAILKKVYQAINGFPVWMDIYGEETAVSMEVMDLGYDIFYDHTIVVNHRVDREKRNIQGRNYFRFERQLRNSFRLFLVYDPNPIKITATLLIHNFRKYALTDTVYFKLYCKAVGNMFIFFFKSRKYRRPIKKATQIRMKSLKNIPY
ncbi:glycosyltransferase family 2 protein [Flavobacterium algicola]|uniref:glycosyltransferase family 2 protein n=1 Tax=Flavobacterium algicola TaxID=556529 RepID=UPI001EFDF5A6|nr:glycosyltransferase family 2 protein [Flavobacterium algicola]MCG9793891.1 glycosyltransferase family 2 protein [Flavobacterium algicola]